MLFSFLEDLWDLKGLRTHSKIWKTYSCSLLNLVAFIVAIIAIKFFIEIIKNTVSSPGDGTELLLVHLLIYFTYLK
jgi:undecaprenyl pyrophosphate phosphatase UppP